MYSRALIISHTYSAIVLSVMSQIDAVTKKGYVIGSPQHRYECCYVFWADRPALREPFSDSLRTFDVLDLVARPIYPNTSTRIVFQMRRWWDAL